MKVSIVIPCYNSQSTIEDVVEETIDTINNEPEFKRITGLEFILVSDCSPDNVFSKIHQLCNKYDFITGVELAKNAGQHNAILAGYQYISDDTDYVVGMDDDHQNIPSEMIKLLNKLDEGYDIVYGLYEDRKHSFARNLVSKFNDWTIRLLVRKPKGLKACNYYAIRRFVAVEMRNSVSEYTNLQGLFLRTSSRIVNTPIKHAERKVGESTYTFMKLLRLWGSFLNYSKFPLRLISLIGVVMVFMAFTTFAQSDLKGDVIFSMFFIALTVLALGIIGEYFSRAFRIISKSPQYVIRQIIGKAGGH